MGISQELTGLLYFILGDIDDVFLTFIFLNAVDLLLNICSLQKSRFITKVRMYVVIILSVRVDSLLKIDTSLKQYVLLCYAYNEIVKILEKLSEDKGIIIPTKLKEIIEKLKK